MGREVNQLGSICNIDYRLPEAWFEIVRVNDIMVRISSKNKIHAYSTYQNIYYSRTYITKANK